MDIDNAGMVRLIHGQGAEGDFRQVDSAQGGTLVDISHQGLTDLDANGALSFFCAASDVGGQD